MQTTKPKTARKGQRRTKKTPKLNGIVTENIETILQHRRELEARKTKADIIADRITTYSGRIVFAVLHAVWFAVWFLLNSGWFGFQPFDPFPYGLLTMIVSLEAIFLSTFILISQSQNSRHDQERAELDLQIDLLTERELTQALVMLDQIQRELGVAQTRDKKLAELVQETKADEILKQIEDAELKEEQ